MRARQLGEVEQARGEMHRISLAGLHPVGVGHPTSIQTKKCGGENFRHPPLEAAPVGKARAEAETHPKSGERTVAEVDRRVTVMKALKTVEAGGGVAVVGAAAECGIPVVAIGGAAALREGIDAGGPAPAVAAEATGAASRIGGEITVAAAGRAAVVGEIATVGDEVKAGAEERSEEIQRVQRALVLMKLSGELSTTEKVKTTKSFFRPQTIVFQRRK
jgi:hypothetical protein